MTVRKLVKVSEYPTQLSSCDRLCFTSDYMLVAYVAEGGMLTVAVFDRDAILSNTPHSLSTTILDTRVAPWANPTLIAAGDSSFYLLYEDSTYFMGERSLICLNLGLNLGLVGLTLQINASSVLARNPGVSFQYDWCRDIQTHVILAGFSSETHDATSIRHIILETGVATEVSTTSDLCNVYGLSFACDFNGLATHIVYGTVSNANQSNIFRHTFSGMVGPQETILNSTHTHNFGLVSDISAISQQGVTVIVYSAMHTEGLNQRIYYLYDVDDPQPIQVTSTEYTTNLHLLHGAMEGQYFLYFVTQNLSRHPRALFYCEIPQLTRITPNLYNMDFRQPHQARVMGLAFGETLTGSFANRIISGTLLLEDAGALTSWLCYYDPLNLNIEVIVPDTLNQPRISSVLIKPVIKNPDGFPLDCTWTSSDPSVTFSSPYSQQTVVHVSASAPSQVILTFTVKTGFFTQEKHITLIMDLHEAPSVSIQDVATNWHTPVTAQVYVNHTVGYTITMDKLVDIIKPISVDIGEITSLLTSATTTTILVPIIPKATSVDGETISIVLTVHDSVASVSTSFNVIVGLFPLAHLAGTKRIFRYSYNGTLRTGNQGLGYTLKHETRLPLDFTDVLRYIQNETPYWVFFGTHSILWVLDWDTEEHTYLISYDLIKDATVNNAGYTGILTDNNFLVYKGHEATPSSNSGDLNFPLNFAYLDTPDVVIPMLYPTLRNGLKVFSTGDPERWFFLTTKEITFVSTDTTLSETISITDLGCNMETSFVMVYPAQVNNSRSGSLLVVVKNSMDGGFTCILLNLDTRATSKVWQGAVLPSREVATALLTQTF